ncbi:hypothetical protein [Paenibacillus koleovorans]|nr:hypothetical protein [Paenibacillus koleovorans]
MCNQFEYLVEVLRTIKFTKVLNGTRLSCKRDTDQHIHLLDGE